MVCASGVGFDSALDGQRLRFELSGIYNGVMVMSDGQSDTVWSHLTGEALHGKFKGRSLTPLTTYSVRWDAWKARHPETTVLAPDPRHEKAYSPSGLGRKGLGARRCTDGSRLEPMFQRTLTGAMDERLSPKAIVLGVVAGSAAKAYPLQGMGSVVADVLDGVPLLVLKDGGGAMAFDRRLEGRVLDFATEGKAVKDIQTGSIWDGEGRCTEGELLGKALKPLFAFVTEWYGWSYYRPGSAIWKATESREPDVKE